MQSELHRPRTVVFSLVPAGPSMTSPLPQHHETTPAQLDARRSTGVLVRNSEKEEDQA